MSQGRLLQRGVTLIELMLGIALLGIIATLTLPSFTAFLDRYRLEGAIEALYDDLQWARSEAVKRNQTLLIEFTPGRPWRYTLQDASSQTIKAVEGADFHNTTLDTPALGGGSQLWLQPNRGAITSAAALPLDGRLVFQSAQGRVACVHFNQLGRVHLCSPAGASHLGGVSECAC